MNEPTTFLEMLGVYKIDKRRRCYYCVHQLDDETCSRCRGHSEFVEDNP